MHATGRAASVPNCSWGNKTRISRLDWAQYLGSPRRGRLMGVWEGLRPLNLWGGAPPRDERLYLQMWPKVHLNKIMRERECARKKIAISIKAERQCGESSFALISLAVLQFEGWNIIKYCVRKCIVMPLRWACEFCKLSHCLKFWRKFEFEYSVIKEIEIGVFWKRICVCWIRWIIAILSCMKNWLLVLDEYSG